MYIVRLTLMQTFIEQATAKYGDIYDYSRAVWTGPRGKLLIGCKKHDVGFEQTSAAHLKQSGCKQCVDAQKTEEFIVKAGAKHNEFYDYSAVNYINSTTKISIGCPTHGFFEQTPNRHLAGSGCLKCGYENRTDERHGTIDSFIQKANEKYNARYDYSKVVYVNGTTKVIIGCPTHGFFEQTPNHHLLTGGCPTCGYENKPNKNRWTTEAFVREAAKIHNAFYDYSAVNCTKNCSKILIGCPLHGLFEQLPTRHLSGAGCQKCSIVIRSDKLRSNLGSFVRKAVEKHGAFYDYSEVVYVDSSTKIRIKCPMHGFFEQLPSNHLVGYGCAKCGTENILNNKIDNFETFVKKVAKKYGARYDYSSVVYVDKTTNICIKCQLHGIFEQTPRNHLNGAACPECVVERCTDTKTFIKKAVEKHGDKYDYSLAVYTNTATNIIIGCPTHGIFEQVAAVHLSGAGCQKCGNESTVNKRILTTEIFVQKAVEKHGELYDYSSVNYINSATKIKIGCRVHGVFEQTPNNHLAGYGCLNCCNENTANKLRGNTDDFIQKAVEKHGPRYDYSKVDYVHNAATVIIVCPTHGIFDQTPTNHLSGRGCPGCGNESVSIKLRGNTDDFVQRAVEKHGTRYDYSLVDYVNNSTKVCIGCPLHGIFEQAPLSHLRGSGCPNCKHKTESKLLAWLETEFLEIEFGIRNVSSQVIFQECKKESTKRCYRYDFRVGKSIVEIDGLQHFTAIDLFKNCPEESLKNDTHKAWCVTLSPRGPNLNLIRIYQPWVADDSNSWEEQLLKAIISLEHVRGQVIYIGGDIYDRHRDAYNEFIYQHKDGQAD